MVWFDADGGGKEGADGVERECCECHDRHAAVDAACNGGQLAKDGEDLPDDRTQVGHVVTENCTPTALRLNLRISHRTNTLKQIVDLHHKNLY